ncbi:hypothetical protein J3P88_12925 [Pseudomonas sp. Z3-6]|uniref:hypothetical protein n=1 Tax=Pseudomonas sp. Z3-6 TaxID=2817411 RepID=UPI003DA7C490
MSDSLKYKGFLFLRKQEKTQFWTCSLGLSRAKKEIPKQAIAFWRTGFRPAVHHLSSLKALNTESRIDVAGTHSMTERKLWLVGYGDWAGSASATLIDVTGTAISTALEIEAFLSGHRLADFRYVPAKSEALC